MLKTSASGLKYFGQRHSNGAISENMEHLTCFIGKVSLMEGLCIYSILSQEVKAVVRKLKCNNKHHLRLSVNTEIHL